MSVHIDGSVRDDQGNAKLVKRRDRDREGVDHVEAHSQAVSRV